MNVRIIPRMDIKGPNLVKGINLEGLRVLGKPEYFATVYYEKGADELLYMDAVASLYGRNSLLHIVEKTAADIFIPLTVGGGLRTIDDIRAALRAGADKVAINTAAVHNPNLIREASLKFGSSTIVVSIDAVQRSADSYEVCTDYGRECTGLDAVEWACRACELGAGEILLTAVRREGTGTGYDLTLTRRIAEALPIPVIACGGAGRTEDVIRVIREGKADAVCAASIFHYHEASAVACGKADFSDEGNVTFLKTGKVPSGIKPVDLRDLKRTLEAGDIACRMCA